MASSILFNGVSYSVPTEGDFSWGPSLSSYLIAISTGALQNTGGTFTLGAEIDFGASFGLKSLYFKSRTALPASAGQVRLGNTESLSWRNAANSADLALSANASNNLLFNARTVLFSGEVVNADINAAAAIAYSKLNLATSIVNADIGASAAIAYSKLAALGLAKVVQTNAATGFLEVSAVTNTELGYLSGVTSAIQTQIAAQQPKATLTTKGDLYVATASAVVARQAIGADDLVLTADSSQTNGMAYHNRIQADLINNLSLAASVATSALTVALKTAAGADASATDPVKVAYRSATLTTGSVSLVKTTASLSIVVPSTATLGHVSATSTPIYVYLLNNAGVNELALSTAYFDETGLVSTTAISAAATSNSVMYSTTARSNVAFRNIGKLISNQTTAGTWAAVPTSINVGDNSKAPYVPLTLLTATSAAKTPTASGNYALMTTNSVALTIGVWEITQAVQVGNNAANPVYSSFGFGLYAANGADSATEPALLSTLSASLTVNSAYMSTAGPPNFYVMTGNYFAVTGPTLIITVVSSTTIYLVPQAAMTTAANSRLTTYLTARKLY